MASAFPPTSVTIHGRPQAIASRIASGSPSRCEVTRQAHSPRMLHELRAERAVTHYDALTTNAIAHNAGDRLDQNVDSLLFTQSRGRHKHEFVRTKPQLGSYPNSVTLQGNELR